LIDTPSSEMVESCEINATIINMNG
jgi:hypothetical protein